MLTKKRLNQLEDARVLAMVGADIHQLESLLSDDMLWVHASGRMDTKATLLSQFSSGLLRCFSMDFSDVIIRVFDSVGLVTGVVQMDTQIAGLRKVGQSRFTAVWWGEDDTARLISWQSANLPRVQNRD